MASANLSVDATLFSYLFSKVKRREHPHYLLVVVMDSSTCLSIFWDDWSHVVSNASLENDGILGYEPNTTPETTPLDLCHVLAID